MKRKTAIRPEIWPCALTFCLYVLLSCTLLLVPAQSVLAENWQLDLKDTNLPSHFVAVDKKNQKFFFFEKNSPLSLTYEFPCMTGKRSGDKQIVNDLKTPEGIYFVQNKIASGLDFKEYGGVAYTLNYPNPVDKLRGKTGHNIWIHSKGFGLVPTRGCVAIGLEDIDTVGPKLTPGTAVIVAEEMHVPASLSPCDQAEELRSMMQDWCAAWSQRSPKMFDFYDQDAYSKVTENFSAFRANKERIFKMINSITLYNRDIHVLEGPGYWVTWAEQCYAASNHTTEGIRRLYWQRGADQRFRIVAMEWHPQNLGLLAEIKEGRLVAQATQCVSDARTDQPALPPVHLPDNLPDNAQEPAKKAGRELLLADLNEPLAPSLHLPDHSPVFERVADKNVADREERVSNGALDLQKTSADLPESRPDAGEPFFVAYTENPRPQQSPANDTPISNQAALSDDHRDQSATDKEELQKLCDRFMLLLSERNPDLEELFLKEKFNRVPKVPKQRSLKNTLRELERLRAEPWITQLNRQATVEKQGDVYQTRQEVLIASQHALTEGEYQLYWQRDNDGQFAIVGLIFTPAVNGLSALWLESVNPVIRETVTNWYKAWEAADIDAYLSFYAENALQQTRRGTSAIRQQKEKLWAQVKPVSISFSGLRVMYQKSKICLDMTQTYTDSGGKTERGVKILFMEYDGTRWRIVEEDWRALAATSGS